MQLILILLLTNKDISLTARGKLYSSCVQSSMLHRSETWPIRKENEVALLRAEMKVVRWMCGVKVQERVPSKGLGEGQGSDDNFSTTGKQVAMVWACYCGCPYTKGDDLSRSKNHKWLDDAQLKLYSLTMGPTRLPS